MYHVGCKLPRLAVIWRYDESSVGRFDKDVKATLCDIKSIAKRRFIIPPHSPKNLMIPCASVFLIHLLLCSSAFNSCCCYLAQIMSNDGSLDSGCVSLTAAACQFYKFYFCSVFFSIIVCEVLFRIDNASLSSDTRYIY